MTIKEAGISRITGDLMVNVTIAVKLPQETTAQEICDFVNKNEFTIHESDAPIVKFMKDHYYDENNPELAGYLVKSINYFVNDSIKNANWKYSAARGVWYFSVEKIPT